MQINYQVLSTILFCFWCNTYFIFLNWYPSPFTIFIFSTFYFIMRIFHLVNNLKWINFNNMSSYVYMINYLLISLLLDIVAISHFLQDA